MVGITGPMAAGIGCGRPGTEARGSLVVGIGGGTTEIAVRALAGGVSATSLRVGGDELDEAIVNHLRCHHILAIGEQTAEEIQLSNGCACPTAQELPMDVKGRDTIQGPPR